MKSVSMSGNLSVELLSTLTQNNSRSAQINWAYTSSQTLCSAVHLSITWLQNRNWGKYAFYKENLLRIFPLECLLTEVTQKSSLLKRDQISDFCHICFEMVQSKKLTLEDHTTFIVILVTASVFKITQKWLETFIQKSCIILPA